MSSEPSFSVVVETLLAQGVSVRFRAGGRSMLPTVRDGECLTVAPIDPEDVALGDVVLCRTWRGQVAHRVHEILRGADGGRRFLTRGDASLELDRPVDGRQVCGLVVGVERNGRVLELASTAGWLGRRSVVAAWRLRVLLTAAGRAVATTGERLLFGVR